MKIRESGSHAERDAAGQSLGCVARHTDRLVPMPLVPSTSASPLASPGLESVGRKHVRGKNFARISEVRIRKDKTHSIVNIATLFRAQRSGANT